MPDIHNVSDPEVREFKIKFSGSVSLKVRAGQSIDEAILKLVAQLCESMAERQPLLTSRILITEQGTVVLVLEPRRKRRAKVKAIAPSSQTSGPSGHLDVDAQGALAAVEVGGSVEAALNGFALDIASPHTTGAERAAIKAERDWLNPNRSRVTVRRVGGPLRVELEDAGTNANLAAARLGRRPKT